MWVAPELLGVLTIDGGSAWSVSRVEGAIEVEEAFQAARNIQKR
jgi:hypothetical protein